MDEPRAVIVSAKISIKHSKSACHFYNGSLAQNYNSSGEFGFTENVLWVHGGCNARFEICYVGKLILLQIYQEVYWTFCL